MDMVKKICRTADAVLVLALFLGAMGGYEAGNYGLLPLLGRLAVAALLMFPLICAGKKL